MITRIQLENFKSFIKATVPLGGLTLVLGANGSGKSNFFDALRFLKFVGMGTPIRDAIEGHASAGFADATVPGLRGGSRALTHLGSSSPVFSLTASLRTKIDFLTYKISVDCDSYRVVAEELKSNRHPGQYVFSTHPSADPPEQDPEGPGITARFYKKGPGRNPKRSFSPNESILSQFRERRAESAQNEEVAEFARLELSSIRPLELRPEVLRQYSSMGTFELGEHGENFAAAASLLRWQAMRKEEPNEEALDRWEAIKAWLSELTPHPVTDIVLESAPTGEEIFGLREEPFEEVLTARSLSDGTLRFAALTLALLGTRWRRTLLIEELENGIHPARTQLLVRMLEEATTKFEGVQVLASTHSPAVLDYAGEEALRHALVLGWDSEQNCSRVSLLRNLEAFDVARADVGVGNLMSEGWLQFAADA